MRWIVLGTGPSAKENLQRATSDGPASVITCNGGLRIHPNPNVYVVTDPVAKKIFADDYLAAERRGVKIMVRFGMPLPNGHEQPEPHDSPALRLREPGHIHYGYNDRFYKNDGKWYHCTAVGIICAQAALRRGATEIEIVGHDGYIAEDAMHLYADYEDPRGMAEAWCERKTRHMVRNWASVIRLNRQCRFRWWGPSRLLEPGAPCDLMP